MTSETVNTLALRQRRTLKDSSDRCARGDLLRYASMPRRHAVVTPGRSCPYCQQPLSERSVSEVQGDLADATQRIVLLACPSGHEFAWREGLPHLLPKRS